MAKAKLEAVFTADASGFFGISEKVQAELQQTTNEAKETQSALSGIGAGAGKAGGGLDNLGGGLKKVGQSANNSAYHMTNFSRVISDAPFGFIAISNNIEPMIASFSAMRAEAKLAGKGLTSFMASTLFSPAGLGVFAAAGTALLVLATQYDIFGSSAKDAGEESEDASNKIKSAFNKIGKIEFDIGGLTLQGEDIGQTIDVVKSQIASIDDLAVSTSNTIQTLSSGTNAQVTANKESLRLLLEQQGVNERRKEQLQVILGELEETSEKYKAELSIREELLKLGFKEEEIQKRIGNAIKSRLVTLNEQLQEIKDEYALINSAEGQYLLQLEASNGRLARRNQLIKQALIDTQKLSVIQPVSTGNNGGGITGLPTDPLANVALPEGLDVGEQQIASWTKFGAWFNDEGTQQMIQATQMMANSINNIMGTMTANLGRQLQEAQALYNQAIQTGNVQQQRMARANMARLEKQRKANFKRQKAWGIATAIINTAVGVTAALTSLPPNVPLAVAVGVAGAAQVAAIASQSLSGGSALRSGRISRRNTGSSSGSSQNGIASTTGRPVNFRSQQVKLADPTQPTIRVQVSGRIETDNTALAIAVDDGNQTLGRVRG